MDIVMDVGLRLGTIPVITVGMTLGTGTILGIIAVTTAGIPHGIMDMATIVLGVMAIMAYVGMVAAEAGLITPHVLSIEVPIRQTVVSENHITVLVTETTQIARLAHPRATTPHLAEVVHRSVAVAVVAAVAAEEDVPRQAAVRSEVEDNSV